MGPSTSKDYDGKYRLSRSLSCSKIKNDPVKAEDLETKHKTSEERNQNQFKEIRQEIANVEFNVTTKLMTEITPSLENMRTELQTAASNDLRRIVQEEVEMMRLREAKEKAKPAEDSSDEEEKGLGPEKNKKSKKKIKNKNLK